MEETLESWSLLKQHTGGINSASDQFDPGIKRSTARAPTWLLGPKSLHPPSNLEHPE